MGAAPPAPQMAPAPQALPPETLRAIQRDEAMRLARRRPAPSASPPSDMPHVFGLGGLR